MGEVIHLDTRAFFTRRSLAAGSPWFLLVGIEEALGERDAAGRAARTEFITIRSSACERVRFPNSRREITGRAIQHWKRYTVLDLIVPALHFVILDETGAPRYEDGTKEGIILTELALLFHPQSGDAWRWGPFYWDLLFDAEPRAP